MLKLRIIFFLMFSGVLLLSGCQTSQVNPLITDARQKTTGSMLTPEPTTETPSSPEKTEQAEQTLLLKTLTPPILSTPTATPEAVCTQKGQMILAKLESPALREPMDYRVFLPPCYEDFPQRRYPVLYLIHGQSYNDDQWDRLGADEQAVDMILKQELPPFILVMPRDRLWEQPKNDPFGQVMVEELIPAIDGEYRTLTERQYRAVGGLSRGGGWAIHFGLTQWQLFGAFGGHSPAVFESDAPKIASWLDEIPRESLPRIFLDIGDHDRPPILQSAIWFEQLLTQKRIPHEWYLFQGYHEEAYWQEHLPLYLRWYSQEWEDIKDEG